MSELEKGMRTKKKEFIEGMSYSDKLAVEQICNKLGYNDEVTDFFMCRISPYQFDKLLKDALRSGMCLTWDDDNKSLQRRLQKQ